MAEVAEPSGEGHGAEVKTQQPAERALAGSSRRGPLSVLKVSQLLLRAIAAHKGLTLAALKKELGNAGYEVRRKSARRSGETSRPEVKGTLLRVSGSEAAGYFRVWKIPKPKRKPGRPKLEEAGRSPRRAPAGARSTRKRRTHRKASRKARAGWRRSTKVNSKARRTRARAKESVRARMPVDEGRGRTSKEDTRAGSQEEKRSSVKQKRSSMKLKEEKKQDTEKPVKRSIQKPTPLKTERAAVGQGKAGTRASTKCEGSRSATGNP